MLLGVRQRFRDVRRVHEPVVHDHPVETVTKVGDLQPLCPRHQWHVLELHMQHDIALMQHLVVLEVVQHCRRHLVGRRGHKHRRALHPRRVARQRLDHGGQRQRGLLPLLGHQVAAPLPRGHEHQHDGCDQQREPATIRDFDHGRGEQ